MIINIRGTSGSGKTYAVRQLMDLCGENAVIYGQGGMVAAHSCYMGMVPLYVIGSYDGPECGGCDVIHKQDMVCSLVRHFGRFGHVVFEGVVIGTIYSRYKSLAVELMDWGHPYIWAYLGTPLELCLKRVQSRRDRRGDVRKFNPSSTEDKYHSIWRTHDKALADGLDVRVLQYEGSVGKLLYNWLMEDEEYDFSISYREESFR